MVLSESMTFNQNTSGNLNPADDTVPLLKKINETLRLEEGSSIISTQEIGHSFILGHSINGVLGVANGTDGQQIILGDGGKGASVVVYVVNPNNTFNEHFSSTTFSTSPTTANWDTTNLRLAMHTSNIHTTIYNTVATLSSIFLNNQTVLSATVNATETKFITTDLIKYYLSADGGANWEEASIGVGHAFTATGQDLRVRIVFIGQGGCDTYIEDLQITYTT